MPAVGSSSEGAPPSLVFLISTLTTDHALSNERRSVYPLTREEAPQLALVTVATLEGQEPLTRLLRVKRKRAKRPMPSAAPDEHFGFVGAGFKPARWSGRWLPVGRSPRRLGGFQTRPYQGYPEQVP